MVMLSEFKNVRLGFIRRQNLYKTFSIWSLSRGLLLSSSVELFWVPKSYCWVSQCCYSAGSLNTVVFIPSHI